MEAQKVEDVHPSEDVIIVRVQNSLGSITILDVLYVMGIVDVLAKLKTADSSLEKESTEQEEGRKKKKEPS